MAKIWWCCSSCCSRALSGHSCKKKNISLKLNCPWYCLVNNGILCPNCTLYFTWYHMWNLIPSIQYFNERWLHKNDIFLVLNDHSQSNNSLWFLSNFTKQRIRSFTKIIGRLNLWRTQRRTWSFISHDDYCRSLLSIKIQTFSYIIYVWDGYDDNFDKWNDNKKSCLICLNDSYSNYKIKTFEKMHQISFKINKSKILIT